MTTTNLTLRKKLFIGFAIPIVFLLLISAIVYQNINSLLNANHWVEHTHKVIAQGKGLLESMVNMETGMRGFLVAGEDEFLEPYRSGQAHFDDAIHKLKQTVSDNPAQVQRLTRIEQMKQQWLNKAAEPQIQMRREISKGEDASAEFKRISARLVGKEKFDGLRAELAVIDDELINYQDIKGRYILQLILTAMINQETGQRGFLLSGQETSLEPYHQGKLAFEEYVKKLTIHLESVIYPVSGILVTLESAVELAHEWDKLAATPEIEARRAMNEVKVSLEDLAAFIEKGEGKKAMDAIRAELEKFVEVEQVLIVQRTQEADEIGSSTEISVIISAIVASVLAAIAGFYIVKNIHGIVGKEPSELAELSRKIADGDLSINVVKTGRETGVYAAMLDMADSLKKLLSNVSDSAASQSHASARLSSTAEQTLRNVRDQNDATDQVAAAMEELNATASEVANSTGLAANSANEARELVKLGNGKAELVAEEINNLSASLAETTKVIEELSNNTGNISNILDVIKNIADQTNLLALNAAIEAARAGEQGRGFAVVAEEVRSLAQNTQNSTLEIEGMIQVVQQGAEESVKSMSIGQEQSEKIVERTSEVTAALGDIKGSVQTITEMTNQIATAAKEQQLTVDEINQRVVDIRELSSQTGDGTREINQSSHELTALSESLDVEVSKFKV